MMRRILLGLILIILSTSLIAANETDEKLQPGNLLSFSLFGNKALTKDFRIDSEGFIQLPEVGKINCTNQTVSTLKAIAIEKLSFVYKNASSLLISKKTNEIYVTVLGLVKDPGPHLIPPNGSIELALQKAGGLLDGAQMNKIQLRQQDKVTIIDYKKYLDQGDTSVLPKLSAMDEIFVPSSRLIGNIKLTATEKASWLQNPSNHTVKIIGGVNKPGRYEWSDEMTLLDLIAEAGGPNNNADISNIKIITNKTGKTAAHTITFNLSRFIEKGGDIAVIPAIKAGYIINVPELIPLTRNDKTTWTQQDPKTVIYVFGEVKKPGRYNFDDKLNFLDIISAADGPTPNADMRDVHLIDRQGIYPQIVHVNLALYFDTGDPELLPSVLSGDAIYVPEKSKDYTEVNTRHAVKILGEVKNPGRYRFTSNMTILDLLSAAGGPTSGAWIKKILIVNIGPNLETKSSVFNLMKFSKTGNMRMLPTIREGDVIYVPNNEENEKARFAELLSNIANIALIISTGRNIAGNN